MSEENTKQVQHTPTASSPVEGVTLTNWDEDAASSSHTGACVLVDGQPAGFIYTWGEIAEDRKSAGDHPRVTPNLMQHAEALAAFRNKVRSAAS